MKHFSLRLNTYYRLSVFDYLILGVILFVSFYLGISSYALGNMNEGLYGEIPREMINTGRYIIPLLNYVPYIEKPPLFYWLITVSYHLFGVSEFSARLIPALSATIVCLSLIFFGNAIRRNREGWMAAVIIATSIGFVLITRVLLIDILLTAFFTLALICFYIWFSQAKKHYLYLFYLFLACGVLTKGLIAFLLIPSIALIFMFAMRVSWKKIFQFFDARGIILFLVIALPWHILAVKHQPNFAWDYFVNEQIYRFLDYRLPHNYFIGPIYFYIPKILMYFLPWSLFIPILFDHHTIDKPLHRFLWIWFIVIFAFLSFSKAKAGHYIAIAMPPLAFLLALKINDYLVAKKTGFLTLIFFLLSLIEITTIMLIYYAMDNANIAKYLPTIFLLDPSYQDILYFLIVAIVSFFILSLITCFAIRKKPVMQFLFIALLTFPLSIFYVIDKHKNQNQYSELTVINYINHHNPDRPIYFYQDYEKISSLPFYLKKRVKVIDSQSKELFYGMRTGYAKDWFLEMDKFVSEKNNPHRYVIVNKGKFIQFLHEVKPLSFCIVSQSGGVVLLSNNLKECD